ncbi:cobalt-precorrin-5B (C(1))-methyltransferase [Paenibacillus massiliensis]|uniref:cobalt-precorrin-5B (C(1))-methyltransferase n=1 Tax=Paenibacillus massiliensis TaxID=225917 RepID=UPI00041DFAD8|nr:cobalt-precorrin-5B (C(1))-methyltransferase [Paenibacillus massiliensis]
MEKGAAASGEGRPRRPKNGEAPAPDKPMRSGFTTGACAAATAKGATELLVTGQVPQHAVIWLPAGFDHQFELIDQQLEGGSATCATIKDGGDDPDATHLAKIVATVSWRDEPGIELDGGIGVGRVTKPGLPVPVGEAAINPVPRRMITEAVKQVLDEYGVETGVRVVISVPAGEEIALKTLNARLGILGGISILGTRGVVVPFSTSAYMASVVQAISVAQASGCKEIVLTTGGRSEKYAMDMYPHLPEEAFIQMGEFVGFSIKHGKRLGMEKATLVGMPGKLSKVAQGVMMVHSKSAPVDFAFLAEAAREAGVSPELVEAVAGANTASQVAEMMVQAECYSFFETLCSYGCRHCLEHVGGGLTVGMVLVAMDGTLLGKATVSDPDSSATK